MGVHDLDGWEVVAVEYVPKDCNWKTEVVKGKYRKTVYFYHKVELGRIVRLHRV